MSAKVHPLPFTLPTGNELMSGPITTGGLTRQEKEIQYVMQNVENRLTHLKEDELFQTYKAQLFFCSLFIAIAGAVLILFGLHLTVFFQHLQDINIPAIVFGSLMFTPLMYWFYYVFIPDKEEQIKRRLIHKHRHNRRKPTLFNQMIKEANKATAPEPKMVRILAHIRKHDYPIVCSTMRELTDGITDECGLAIERQLLRFNDQDLELHLNEKVDEYYGMQHNDRVYVYNKGGYYTKTSPLKHERVSILQRLQEEANEIPDDEKPFEISSVWNSMKKLLSELSSKADTDGTAATGRPSTRSSSVARGGTSESNRPSISNNNNSSSFMSGGGNSSSSLKSSFRGDDSISNGRISIH